MISSEIKRIEGKIVECKNRTYVPLKDETIFTDFDKNILLPVIKFITIYYRDPRDCPYARGNWMIDMTLIDNNVFCYKLPKEMKEEDFMNYCQPLIDEMDKKELK